MATRSGYLDLDSQGSAIQQGAYWQTYDNSATPKPSPQAIASASGTAFKAPQNCLGAWFQPLVPCVIATGSGAASSASGMMIMSGVNQYFPMKSGSLFTVIGTSAVTAASTPLYFVFNMLNTYPAYGSAADQ